MPAPQVPEWDLVLSGGTVVNANRATMADVAILGEQIAAVGPIGSLGPTRRTVDVHGKLVMPGGVDAHVHADDQVGDFRTRDTFYECSIAALRGGTTTIVDFVVPSRTESLANAVSARASAAARAAADVALHVVLPRADAAILDEVPGLIARGFRTFKLFTVYEDVGLTVEEVGRCLHAIAASDGLALMHAEAPSIIDRRRRRLMGRGLTSARWHAAARPPESEVDMVRQILTLLRATGCKSYFVHLSTPNAVRLVSAARASGVSVWAETCPHYVFLSNQAQRSNPELLVCSPPLRRPETARALWALVTSGAIHLWSSDHCAYDSRQKAQQRDAFWQIPNGLPGVETRSPLLFSEGVLSGAISAEAFVALTSTNPARLNGLYPRKGVIAVGSDADIVVWNRNRDAGPITGKSHAMKTDITPFLGRFLRGSIDLVLRRGALVDTGVNVPKPGTGSILRAGQVSAPDPP